MKKHILSLSLLFTCLTVLAQDFEYEYEGTKLTYTIINEDAKICKLKDGFYDNNTYNFKAGNNVSGDVVIPSEANAYKVTEIPDYAFYNCRDLNSITIPNSITSIGRYAFYNCEGLSAVYITDIAAWCNISFGDNPLPYAHNLYLNGEKVTDLVIPDGVTNIGLRAFSGCNGLISITIPNSVTYINDDAFMDCI